jgi:hypothetical protein
LREELVFPALGSISTSAATALRAAQYELKLSAAISSLGYIVNGAERPDYGLDLLVADQETTRTVGVVAKYRESSVTRPWLERSVQPLAGTIPLLIVTNMPVFDTVSAWAAHKSQDDAPIRVTHWRGENDNQAIRDSLAELFSSISPK